MTIKSIRLRQFAAALLAAPLVLSPVLTTPAQAQFGAHRL